MRTQSESGMRRRRTVSRNRICFEQAEIAILPCWDLSEREFREEFGFFVRFVVLVGGRELVGDAG